MLSSTSFTRLDVWKKSMLLVKNIYVLLKSFPKEELYGLSSQMKRCSVSIVSNIAEGSQRSSVKDFSRFLTIALGSTGELQTQLLLAHRLHFIYQKDVFEDTMSLLIDIRKMIVKLKQYLHTL